jgi:hypothetical protein
MGMEGSVYELYLPRRTSPLVEHHVSGSEATNPPVLEPFIITPTFVKQFAMPHIQTTWHNAFVELRECTRLVFLGYSMPEADYHFRTLLRRAVRPGTEVEVILTKNDELRRIPHKYRWTSATTRFQQFFREPRVKHFAVKGYFARCFGRNQLPSYLKGCRSLLRSS